MVKAYVQQIKILTIRLLFIYLAYTLCRLLFYFANINYFEKVEFSGLLADLIYGLRFDTFSIVVSNCLFIVLSLVPFSFYHRKWYQKLLFWLYLASNTIFIAFNCIDVGYFPFIRKRSSADIFDQIGGQSDLGKLIPQFLRDFWWIVLFFIAFIGLIVYLYKRYQPRLHEPKQPSSFKKIVAVVLLFLMSIALSVLGVRGGFQRIPLSLVDAGAMTESEEVPILINSPFSIIKSFENKAIEEYHFFEEADLKRIYNPVHQYSDSVFKKQNVVVIILESFALEYTKLGRKSYTPFLDSLMNRALVCNKAFSNGSKSIEGIPAILSSMPSLNENPFINSLYALNDQTSIANLLSKEGYTSAFFHGGINGTMNFDSYAALAGYQSYFGKNEYGNNADFDGFWGIWDEPFLQYSIQKMNEFKQPFHSAIFTLSSHHPYQIPQKYKGKFPKGDLDNSESIGYSDYALRQFFSRAQKTNWYKNTLFVITADHGSLSTAPFYRDVVGNQMIPVLFFKADESLKGLYSHTFSQVDILPTVMHLLGYNKPFFSFGQSLFDTHTGFDFFKSNVTHCLYTDSLLYCFNSLQLDNVYNYYRDSTLNVKITGNYPALDSLATLQYRAYFQTYHSVLLHNTGRLK